MDFEEQNRSQPAGELFDLGAPQEPPKKKNTGLIIGVIAVVAAIAIAIGAMFALGVFKGKEPEPPESFHEAMVLQEKQNFYKVTDAAAAYVGFLSNTQNTSENGAKMDLHLLLSDDLLSVVEMYMAAMGADLDVSWLKDISLTYKTNAADSGLQILLDLGLADTRIASLDMIMGNDGLYIGVPGLNPYYLKQETQTDGAAMFDFAGTLQKNAQLQQTFFQALPAEAQLQQCFRSYADLLLATLENPVEGTQEVTVAGISRNYTTVTYKITEAQWCELCTAMLKKAETDETLKKLVTAISDYTNETIKTTYPDATEEDLYQNMLDSIQEALAQLEEDKANSDPGNYMELTGYLNEQWQLLGHQVNIFYADKTETESLRWVTATDGNTKKTEVTITGEDAFTLTVTGEELTENGIYNGTFTFTGDGEKKVILKLQDVKKAENTVTGSILLTANQPLLEELLADIALPLSMFGQELGLQLDFDLNETNPALELHLVADGKSVIGITGAISAHETGSITIPGKDQIKDELEWANALDLDALMENLEKAGVPKDLLTSLMVFITPVA